MIKAVIFDLDGVLVDSEKFQYKAFCILFKNYKLKFGKNNFNWVGKTSIRNIEHILKKNKSKLNSQKLAKERERIYFRFIKNKLKLGKGVKTALKFLKDKGIKTGLASQSKKGHIYYVLSLLGLKNYFDIIVSSEEVKHAKPSPDIYLKACQKLNILPKETIAIEDSPIGVKSAMSAGLVCLALSTKYYNKKELKNAHFIIKNVALLEIKKFLRG